MSEIKLDPNDYVIIEDTKAALETEFRKAVAETSGRLKELNDQATELLREAVKLSEETGVPFFSNWGPDSQWYNPSNEKFGAVDEKTVREVLDSDDGYWWGHVGGYGWQNSYC